MKRTKVREHEIFLKGFVRVPLKRSRFGMWEVNARVNGLSIRFVVDSGANRSVIDPSDFSKLKLVSQKADGNRYSIQSVETDVKFCVLKNLKLNHFTFSPLNMVILNLEYINRGLEAAGLPKIGGILGSDFLSHYQAVVDFKRSHMYLNSKRSG